MRKRVALQATVSVGLLVVLLAVLPWSTLRAAWGRVSWQLWLTALAGFLAGHVLGAVKWRALVNAGRAALRPRDAAGFYGAALFANLCLPGVVGGDLLRAGLAARRTGRPEAAILGGVADRVADAAATALLVLAGALTARGSLPPTAARALETLVVLGAAGTGVLLLLTRRPLVRWPRRLRRPAGRTLVALRYMVRRPRTALLALGISIAMQAGFVLVNAEIGRAVGIGVPLAVWFVAWPLAKLVGLLPISLGGLVVRDATLAALLAPAGVPMALGVAAGLAWQSVLLGGGLVGALVWWWHSGGLALRLPVPLRSSVGRSAAR